MTIIFLIIGFAILYCYFVYIAPALSKRRLKKLQNEMMESQQRIDTLLAEQDRVVDKIGIATTEEAATQKPGDINHIFDSSIFDNDDPMFILKVDARLIILNLDNQGEDRLIHVTDYAPISCCFRGYFVGGPQDGQVIEVNLDYNKEAINPETGERIPGIKRFLRQHRLKPQ